MKPLREEASDALELQASDLLAEGSVLPVWASEEKAAVWERLAGDARARERAFWPRLGWQLPLALAGSFAMLAFALVHPRATFHAPVTRSTSAAAVPEATGATSWSTVDLGSVGKLRVDHKAVYRLPAAGERDYRIGLDEGKLCAEVAHRDPASQGPLLIQTPQLQVFVIGTSFCVEVRDGISRVSVTQGRVRVQAPSGAAFVSAGETLGSNDGRLAAKAGTALGSPAGGTLEIARPATVPRMLADASSGGRSMPAATPQAALPPSALAEQNALYAKGTLARDRHDGPGALAAWGTFLEQFPQGVLAPEAATGILSELVEQGRDREALTAADDYLGRFPADGRAAEVAFIRGNLLREKLGRTADALAAYQQALALATRPRLRDDALFAVGACQGMLGHTAQARDTFKQYQTQFPGGAHSGELSRWLSETR
jgi:TolA-binding protein